MLQPRSLAFSPVLFIARSLCLLFHLLLSLLSLSLEHFFLCTVSSSGAILVQSSLSLSLLFSSIRIVVASRRIESRKRRDLITENILTLLSPLPLFPFFHSPSFCSSTHPSELSYRMSVISKRYGAILFVCLSYLFTYLSEMINKNNIGKFIDSSLEIQYEFRFYNVYYFQFLNILIIFATSILR